MSGQAKWSWRSWMPIRSCATSVGSLSPWKIFNLMRELARDRNAQTNCVVWSLLMSQIPSNSWSLARKRFLAARSARKSPSSQWWWDGILRPKCSEHSRACSVRRVGKKSQLLRTFRPTSSWARVLVDSGSKHWIRVRMILCLSRLGVMGQVHSEYSTTKG